MSHFALAFLQHLNQYQICNNIKITERWKKRHVHFSEMEIIHDGWLIKLSSDRRFFRKKKWNKYWFVLIHSPRHSGQVILEYYKNSNCHNLRGRIDLSQCEQLDSGLLFGKEETVASNGFDIQTVNKTYYLIAETEIEMNKWVGCISSVCGLKLKVNGEHVTAVSSANEMEPVTSPPLISSASSEIDMLDNKRHCSPYILISECFTGEPLPNWPSNIDSLNYSYPRESDAHLPFQNKNYDYPKPTVLQETQDVPSFHNNFIHELYQIPPPPRVCETDFFNKTYSYPNNQSDDSKQKLKTFEGINLGNNIFMYNSGPAIYHQNSDIEIARKEALQLAQQLESFGFTDSDTENKKTDSLQSLSNDCTNDIYFQNKDDDLSAEILVPPPRPPKPPNLYKRIQNVTSASKENDIYDFPLLFSKTTNTDTNNHRMESVGTHVHLHSEMTPVSLDDMYDIPKPRNEDNLTILLTTNSLHSKETNLHIYDNAPPMCMKSLIPVHEQEASSSLDHGVKTSLKFLAEQIVENNTKDSGVLRQGEYYDSPPLVNRNLKPKRTVVENDDAKSAHTLAQSLVQGNSKFIIHRETFSTHSENNQDGRIVDLDCGIERPSLSKTSEIQYLDLNLDNDISKDTSKLETSQAKRTTIYKTVDFLRTEAFNKMRQNLEAVYRSSN